MCEEHGKVANRHTQAGQANASSLAPGVLSGRPGRRAAAARYCRCTGLLPVVNMCNCAFRLDVFRLALLAEIEQSVFIWKHAVMYKIGSSLRM